MTQTFSARQVAMILAVVIVAATLPFIAPNDFIIHTVCIALVYAVLAASWDLLYGFAGLISFGHAGFFGLGAYSAALFTTYLGLPAWFGPPVGAVAGALLGVAIGVPTLRLRGVYQALSTLAFSESLHVVATNWYSVTRGTLGFNQHPTFFRMIGELHKSYYVMLATCSVCVAVIWWIARRSRMGMTFRAMRDDDIRARALGINIVQQRVLVFTLSGLFAGLAGAIYAHYVGLVSPSELGPSLTILVIAMSTIGGVGTIIGPAVAAVVLYALTELLHLAGTVYNQIAIGALLIAFVLFLPDGIAGWFVRHGRRTPAKS
ncbi:MAG TPA: branched-chain amino acid ABC transporter permease [Pseudolabrys sp.]|nr:branched-chain amino acid ABC transporter permease [Pseudolabrys sp.]HZT24091.1 branched-chain amino acid ABC transporter permease [Pseudolabrys sp.]